ncbi:hypothetical protein [Mycetocola zhadangensis]|uniref:Polysaccharide chain length determinant N-terminal domain-containing protein n=1 Tax=Mycetocola zhadangensis TaxID=1164595 RepID=A0A3L7J1Y4_9MICO|nr:hypothetical protein [Mycetocola zhadangensis]RLQ84576.1 hypothetical protein D9V28_10450 [Mycetocola zhadangensis]GGE91732.1 hypothetical protein GCM10011313_13280 [Mycetocola zhadangensis]
MRLAETFSVLKRRWYLVVAGLLLTATGCYYIYAQVPATYEAKGSVVLMPPSATVGDEGNPYLFLGGMGQALDVLTRHVNAAEIVDPVLDAHPGTSYTIEPDRDTSGSIIQVVATGPAADETMDVLAAALDTIPISLDAMQDELSIEDYLRIGLMTVVVDTEPTIEQKQRVQLLIFVAAGGIVGTLLLAGLIDGILLSKRRRKLHPDDAEPQSKTEHTEPVDGFGPPRNPTLTELAGVTEEVRSPVSVPHADQRDTSPVGALPTSQIPRKKRKVRVQQVPSEQEDPSTSPESVGASRS